ncbi:MULTISPECIES: L-lactate dehydrogenase [unclassified Granulicatella]|uniref:lactate/malate family dehydrogenase n=1 Tax=unclassified Granulicatella TaxID=2630493 RepID=UPI0010744872|nr:MULTISPECIES: L-lactate dehydrogenase [unclassified Granulicatella]MBF0780721.1 L-lactate dehydrogenase [Granulicatella sp. 19428wC4_WM01]TFU94183.1 L-lactate dehydrogenase [Granulicatella sp. WM01]
MKPTKLGIIGIGHVGSSVLSAAMHERLFSEIVTIDTRKNYAFGEALDHAHATGLMNGINTYVKEGTYADLSDADIIIIAATHVYPKGETPPERQDLLKNNANIVRDIMSKISEQTKEAVLIFITNPADTIVYIAATEFDYPKHLVIGTGCMLDSARLRYMIAQHYQIDPKSVSGFMLAEHGMTAFPATSHLMVGGMPYAEFVKAYPHIEPLSAEQMKEKVVQSAYDVFYAKQGVTDRAVAQAAIDLARAIVFDEKTILPVSSLLMQGEYASLEPIALTTPCVIGKNGVEKVFEMSLNDWEREHMEKSMACIYQSIQLAQYLKP